VHLKVFHVLDKQNRGVYFLGDENSSYQPWQKLAGTTNTLVRQLLAHHYQGVTLLFLSDSALAGEDFGRLRRLADRKGVADCGLVCNKLTSEPWKLLVLPPSKYAC